LFTGYQAEGSLGRILLGGAPRVRIHGQVVEVRARIAKLDNLSAHADSKEIIDWLRALHAHPTKVFVTHGELSAARTMQEMIRKEFNWDAIVPRYGQQEELD